MSRLLFVLPHVNYLLIHLKQRDLPFIVISIALQHFALILDNGHLFILCITHFRTRNIEVYSIYVLFYRKTYSCIIAVYKQYEKRRPNQKFLQIEQVNRSKQKYAFIYIFGYWIYRQEGRLDLDLQKQDQLREAKRFAFNSE